MKLDTWFKDGIISGVLTILLFHSVWLSFPKHAFGLSMYYASFLIVLMFMIISIVKQAKNTNQNNLKKLIKTGFLVFMVSSFIFYLYYYLMHRFNPSIAQYQMEDWLQWAPNLMTKGKLSESIRDITASDFRVTFSESAFAIIRSAISGFVWSLLIGFAVRKRLGI